MSERSQLSANVLENWKKANVIPIFQKEKEVPRKRSLISLTSVLGKVIEQIILEAVTKHIKDTRVKGE